MTSLLLSQQWRSNCRYMTPSTPDSPHYQFLCQVTSYSFPFGCSLKLWQERHGCYPIQWTRSNGWALGGSHHLRQGAQPICFFTWDHSLSICGLEKMRFAYDACMCISRMVFPSYLYTYLMNNRHLYFLAEKVHSNIIIHFIVLLLFLAAPNSRWDLEESRFLFEPSQCPAVSI